MRTLKAIETLPISTSVLAELAGLNPVTLRRKLAGKTCYTLQEQDLRKILVVLEELEGLVSLCINAVTVDLVQLLGQQYSKDFEGDTSVSIL